jgi:hypothetical protein
VFVQEIHHLPVLHEQVRRAGRDVCSVSPELLDPKRMPLLGDSRSSATALLVLRWSLAWQALASGRRFVRLYPDDGAGRAVLLAGPALDADLYMDVAFGVAFLDGVTGTSRHTGPTQDAFIGD